MKMKSINMKFFIIIILISISLGSCHKTFLDVNQDPNRVTDANITGELIFPQAENGVGQRQASGNWTFAYYWMGYLAGNGGFVPLSDIVNYAIDFTFGDALFQNHYAVLFDLHQSQVKSLASGDTALAAASMILSADLFQQLVDLFGDIPYSQAFQTNTYSAPAYDNAQSIYSSLQAKLDTAISFMQLTTASAFSRADIINHGDVTKWIHFANTLKLRLLIRQSQVSGFNPSAEITKIINTGGVLGPGESITVNPGYVNDVNKQNPFYAGNGWTPTGALANNSTDANNYILNILKSNNDPRLSRFFFPVGFTGSTYTGNTLGNVFADLISAANSSYFGPALDGDLIPGTNIGDGYSKDQWIYPSFESMFLYAEAAARGWIPGADPQAAYMAAITESFTWLGVPNADSSAASYMANNDDANWANAGSSPLDRAKFVVYQKYIALTEIDPLEAYSDERRLNFLTDPSYISIAPSRVSNTLPLRLLYPQSEYTTNEANVLKEGTIDPFHSKIFWEP